MFNQRIRFRAIAIAAILASALVAGPGMSDEACSAAADSSLNAYADNASSFNGELNRLINAAENYTPRPGTDPQVAAEGRAYHKKHVFCQAYSGAWNRVHDLMNELEGVRAKFVKCGLATPWYEGAMRDLVNIRSNVMNWNYNCGY
jgi:hypothetical protein